MYTNIKYRSITLHSHNDEKESISNIWK